MYFLFSLTLYFLYILLMMFLNNTIQYTNNIWILTIWLIPQGTINNKLGPDRFEGLKALDPNYYRQPTLWLHNLCLEVQTVHGIEFCLFRAKAFPILILLMSAYHIALVGTAFNVLSYDTVWAGHRTHHLPNAEQIRYVLCNGPVSNID